MSTIFISHSSGDNALARELGKRLAAKNHHSVFLDLDPEKGIVAGQSWEQTLYRKLRSCRAVVALCTDNYLASQWCFAEIALARMEGKHIVALQADPLAKDAKMPAILTERQFIDLRKDREEAYRRLWRGLEEMDLLGVAGDWDPKKPPYLGLSAYQEEHAPVFFGREDESRAGIELLSRGAPGLIMVLGASGSGKSSLVRAGMIPRLRREQDAWLVVDPFRPGRDPYTELAESLAQAYRRYAPEHAARAGSEEIRSRLEAWTPPLPTAAPADEQTESRAAESTLAGDERLRRLIDYLEELRSQPLDRAPARLRDFLDWSLEDLRRISGETLASVGLPAAGAARPTPLVDLAEELQRASGRRNARVLVIVDQFEELLGRDGAADRTDRFLALLRASLEAERAPLMAVGTMRSDFLGLFQRNSRLRGIDFESLSLGPVKSDGMRRIIEEPAKLGAIELEKGLADRLIEDTETPDALPLLSFTLWVLWRDYRVDGRLEVSEYEDLGGLDGAVASEADALLASARKEGKEEQLRKAFLRMARLTEEGNYARQPVQWEAEELVPVHAALERFVDRRLLFTRDEDGARMVEVAHEALFRSWKPLRAWLDNHRSELLLRQQIRRDTAVWLENDRAADNLWRGGRLQQAGELMRRAELEEAEREFVQSGLRRRRRQRLTAAGVTALVIAGLVVLSGWALWARAEAERAQDEAQNLARAGVASTRIEHDPMNSNLLLLEVEKAETMPFVMAALHNALGAPLARELQSEAQLVVPQAFSPDGTLLAMESYPDLEDESVGGVPACKLELWDALAGAPLASQPLGELKNGTTSFSPRDNRVLAVHRDGRIRIWDARAPGDPITGETTDVRLAWYSDEGDRVLTLSRVSNGWLARVLASADGKPVSPPFELPLDLDEDDVGDQAILPRGLIPLQFARGRVAVQTEEDKVRVWLADSGEEMEITDRFGTRILGFSLAADRVLSEASLPDAEPKDFLAVSELMSGKLIATFQSGAGCQSARFSPDGLRLALSCVDGRDSEFKIVTVAEIPSWIELEEEETGKLTHIIVPAPAVVLENPREEESRGELYDGELGEGGLLFNRDGSRVFNVGHSRTGVWDAATGRLLMTARGSGAAVSADGKWVVTLEKESSKTGLPTRLWQLPGTAELTDLPGEECDWCEAALEAAQPTDPSGESPEDSCDKALAALEARSAEAEGPDATYVISPDRQRIAEVTTVETHLGDSSVVRLRECGTGEPIRTLRRAAKPRFSADGRHLLTLVESEATLGREDATAAIWHAETGRSLAQLKGHDGEISEALFSPTGKSEESAGLWVFTASETDQTARLWHAESGTPIATLPHGDSIRGAAFSEDGSRLVTVTGPGAGEDVAELCAQSRDDRDTGTRCQVWAVSAELLQALIRSRTNLCLSADFRMTQLGESQEEAERKYERCEECRGVNRSEMTFEQSWNAWRSCFAEAA